MFSLSFLSEQFLELLGVAGFVFYMLAYALLQLGKISGQSYSYTLLNMLAASLVLLSLYYHFNLASLLIQISWIVISIIGLVRLRSRAKSKPVNSKLMADALPATRTSVRAEASPVFRIPARRVNSAYRRISRLPA